MRRLSLAVVVVITAAAVAAAVDTLGVGGHARAAATRPRAITPHRLVVPGPGSCYVAGSCSQKPGVQFVSPGSETQIVTGPSTSTRPPRHQRLGKPVGRSRARAGTAPNVVPRRSRCLPARTEEPIGVVVAGSRASAAANPSVAHHHQAISRHPEAVQVRKVLRGDGIGRARFGETATTAIHQVGLLLGQNPTRPYHPASACHVDHSGAWPGPILFFDRGRLVGYTYAPPKRLGSEPVLATVKGIRVGDTLARGRELYGAAFHWTSAQGGAWSVLTTAGRIEGFAAHSPPIGARSTVGTIEAGDVGCAAMTP